jgi:hypothetical protein
MVKLFIIMTDLLNGLTKISTPPSEQAAFDAWLELRDAIEFLKANDHQLSSWCMQGYRTLSYMQ